LAALGTPESREPISEADLALLVDVARWSGKQREHPAVALHRPPRALAGR
jgi:hypothetical protein